MTRSSVDIRIFYIVAVTFVVSVDFIELRGVGTLIQRLLEVVLASSSRAMHRAGSRTFRLERSVCRLVLIGHVFARDGVFIDDPFAIAHAMCIHSCVIPLIVAN